MSRVKPCSIALLIAIAPAAFAQTPPATPRPQLWEPGGAEHVPAVDPNGCKGKKRGDRCGAGTCQASTCTRKTRRGRLVRYDCLVCVPPAID